MKKRISLAGQIFIALVLAIIVGLLMQSHVSIAITYIKPFGTIFLNLLKFIICPIVLFSIMCGILSMKDIKKVGAIGWKTLVYFMCTTAVAISIGLAVSSLTKGWFPSLAEVDVTESAVTAGVATVSLMDTLVNMFPSNFIAPFLNAEMLQVIVIALIIGFSIVLLGERAEPVSRGIEILNDVFVKAMDMILKLSPIGVFCLLCPVVAENGAEIVGSLAKVLLAAYICYILQCLLVYCTTIHAMGGVSALQFLKGMAPAMIFAFSSASSVGTLPINSECCDKLGANKEVTAFVLPLGATINMGGTAIYQGVCAVFIATCYGINLSLGDMAKIVVTGTLAAVGTAGVPGAGPVMLAMVLQSVGLPVDGIALVMGVDRIFDMGRTVLNITGDAACAIIVSNLERKKEARKTKKA